MDNSSADSEVQQLTKVTIIFGPFVCAVFMIAVVSNLLLLALICKAHQVSNNTNIYLFSLGLVYIMISFITFTLIVTLAAQEWVLGKVVCSINQLVFRITVGIITCTFVVMSRDRYRAVVHPFSYLRGKKRSAIVISTIIWILSLVVALPGSVFKINIIAGSSVLMWKDCFFGNSQYLIIQSPLLIVDYIYTGIVPLCSAVTLYYYALISKALREISLYRRQFEISRASLRFTNTSTTNLKPITCSTEKQTAKTLKRFILFQLVSGFIALLLLVLTSLNLLSSVDLSVRNSIYVAGLFSYLLPTTNSFLFLLNKRYRSRVKCLLKCRVLPESTATESTKTLIKSNKVYPMRANRRPQASLKAVSPSVRLLMQAYPETYHEILQMRESSTTNSHVQQPC